MKIIVEFNKLLIIPVEPATPNAVYFIKSEIDGTVNMYVTDEDGNIESPGNPEFVTALITAAMLVKTNTAPILLSSTVVDLNEGTAAKQNQYLVPASRRAIITRTDIDKLSAVPTIAEFTMGWNAGATNTLDPFLVSDLVAATTKFGSILVQPTSWLVGTAGQYLGLAVSTPEGTALTARVNVFGYLTDTNGVPIANV